MSRTHRAPNTQAERRRKMNARAYRLLLLSAHCLVVSQVLELRRIARLRPPRLCADWSHVAHQRLRQSLDTIGARREDERAGSRCAYPSFSFIYLRANMALIPTVVANAESRAKLPRIRCVALLSLSLPPRLSFPFPSPLLPTHSSPSLPLLPLVTPHAPRRSHAVHVAPLAHIQPRRRRIQQVGIAQIAQAPDAFERPRRTRCARPSAESAHVQRHAARFQRRRIHAASAMLQARAPTSRGLRRRARCESSCRAHPYLPCGRARRCARLAVRDGDVRAHRRIPVSPPRRAAPYL
ncbi:hypothetical protein DFH06DRAFT_1429540, partial [Mycena polygramma]